jgi:hypothetical protein
MSVSARVAVVLVAALLSGIASVALAQADLGMPDLSQPSEDQGQASPPPKVKPDPPKLCQRVKSRAISGCDSKCQYFQVCEGQPAVPLACAPPPCS